MFILWILISERVDPRASWDIYCLLKMIISSHHMKYWCYLHMEWSMTSKKCISRMSRISSFIIQFWRSVLTKNIWIHIYLAPIQVLFIFNMRINEQEALNASFFETITIDDTRPMWVSIWVGSLHEAWFWSALIFSALRTPASLLSSVSVVDCSHFSW